MVTKLNMFKPVYLGIGALALSVAFSAQAVTPEAGTGTPTVETISTDQVSRIVQGWPDVSVKAANAMMQKYGAPDEATPSMLVWENNGPWLRTIVYKETIDHDFPMPHKDVLEQFISYKVPVDKFDDLAAYDGSVIAERTRGELSARCDKEAANFVALNLADDIVNGEKSVEEARQAYAEAIKATMGGNPPEIAQALTFNVNRSYAGDPDKTTMKMSKN